MKKWIWILLLVLTINLTGCGQYIDYDNKPDDEFSKLVKETFSDDFYYLRREETERYGIRYEFQIMRENAETIEDFYSLANEYYLGSDERVSIDVELNVDVTLAYVFSISNLSYYGNGKPDYDGLYCLEIGYIDFNHDPFWDDISIYASLSGIKKISIDRYYMEQAGLEENDLYELFPDIEEVEIYDMRK